MAVLQMNMQAASASAHSLQLAAAASQQPANASQQPAAALLKHRFRALHRGGEGEVCVQRDHGRRPGWIWQPGVHPLGACIRLWTSRTSTTPPHLLIICVEAVVGFVKGAGQARHSAAVHAARGRGGGDDGTR